MSKNNTQNRSHANSTNPFATLIECVGTAVVAVAMVPAMIVDAVVSSVTS